MRTAPASGTSFWLILALASSSGSPAAGQAHARVGCSARENDAQAPASLRVLRGDNAIARGACGRDLEVPPGVYEVAVGLDGVLGGPEQRWRIDLRAGQREIVHANFETGELLVELRQQGRRRPGQVRLLEAGRELARLSAGVASRLAIGVYTLEVELRGETRRVEGLAIARSERRVITVDFDRPGQ